MSEAAARLEVAQGGRILYALNVVDAFGHLSRRHPERPDRFLMSRSMAPGLVTPDDVIEHDFDGEPVGAPGTRVFLERFIHAEIFRARADVTAIVHSHSASVVPFTVVDAPVRPIAHVCGFLHGVAPAFDVADLRGDDTDLLIRDASLGRALCAHLGDASVALMRGHGFTAVVASVPEAVYARYTAVNCDLYLAAIQLGAPRFLSAGEAAACEVTNRPHADLAWELWISQHTRDSGARRPD